MRKKLTLTFLVLIILGCYVIAEDFAAKVNEQIITISDFERSFESAKKQLAQQEAVDFNSDEGELLLAATKRSILEEMVDFALLKQGAVELGIEVSEKEVEERIKKVQLGFPSKAVFSEALIEDGISMEDLQQGIRQELLIEKITNQLAKSVNINDGDIENFFNRNKELFSQPKRIQILQMLLPTKEEAEEILIKLNKGEDFKKLAKKYSIDQVTAADGGELGFIEASQLSPFLAEIVLDMNKNEIKGPIEANEGFYIIKCGDILDKKEAKLDTSKDQVKSFLIQEKKRNIYERWFELYKNKANIQINQELFPRLNQQNINNKYKNQGPEPQTLEEKSREHNLPVGNYLNSSRAG